MKKEYYLFIACYLSAFAYGGIYLLIEYTQVNLSGTVIDFGNFLLFSGVATVMTVGMSGSVSKKYGAHIVSSAGILLCGVSLLMVSLLDKVDYTYYLISIFIGLGWSFYHASSSMIVLSPLIKDEERGKYLSLISVFTVIGTATLPVIYNITTKLNANYSLELLYQAAFISSLISASIFLYVGHLFGIKKEEVSIKIQKIDWPVLKGRSNTAFVMVFLGACVFSAMMTFQVQYAKERVVEYSLFFIFYALAVILSRLLFGGTLTKNNPVKKLPIILLLMIAGLLLLLFNFNNNFMYSISAILIGTSYGLAYPLIKTYSIKVSSKHTQHQVIAFFTLSYFIGVYFFPIVASNLLVHYSTNAYLLMLILIVVAYLFISLKIQNFSNDFFKDKEG